MGIEVADQQAVDLGHLLAFQLDPAPLLEKVQGLHHPAAFGLMLLIQGVEVHRGPGPGAAGGLDNRRDKVAPLALELRQQHLGLHQELETVLGEIRITRRDQATQLQLHQQGLERQLADIALVRQGPEQELPLAIRDSALQLVQHPSNPLQLRRIAVDEVLQHIEAVAIGQYQAIGRLAVAPGPTYFLAVVLDGLGQVEMHHVADIGLVDAHAEGDGGDNAVQLPAHELLLDSLPLLMGQAGVIGRGRNFVPTQVLGDLLGGLLQGDVDDTRLPEVPAQPFHQPAMLVLATDRFHQQVQVRPIETGGDHIIRCNGELGLHIGDHFRRCGGGQQQGLGNTELALIVRQLQIVRTEIVAPLGNTVRLVHHQQGNLHLLEKVAKALVLQAFHGNHQDLQLAGARPGHHRIGFIAALGRVDARRRNAVPLQKRQLVLHQRQQRRHHQRQVWQEQRRQLITQGLAGTGRKDRRRRTPGQYRTDRCLLTVAKLWITKNPLEGVVHKLSLR